MWRCFKREGHGPLQMVEALKVSCDSYFYELGHRMGLDALSEVAHQLGFGQKTDIGFAGETAGILPSKEYYKKRFGYVAPGFVVNMSIGQGDLSVSPIQMAMAYGAMANGGTVYKPQLVKEIINDQGEVIKRFEPQVKGSIADSALNFTEILHGLSFVTEPGGSAHSIRYKPEHADLAQWIKNENIVVVGKTGTAQVVKLSKLVKHVDPNSVPYEHRDHAWFVGVYPQHAPKIIVVVMTEHASGTGGAISAPVTVRVMKKWHEKHQPLLAVSGG
jgi:penicillin-binding protein 2